MARVDRPAATGDREELKREIRQEIRQEELKKKLAGCGGCLVAVLIVIGLPTLWIASLFAKTGFVEVPVLTSWLYKPAEPERVVLPLGGSTSESVMRTIAGRVSAAPHLGLLTVAARENEITTLLVHAVWSAQEKDLPMKIRNVQVAVDNGSFEVFIVSPRGRRDATVLARVVPSVAVDGTLKAEVRELRIGALEIPHWAAQGLASATIAAVSGTIQTEIAKVGSIVNVETKTGELDLVIAPKQR
jgi:hypothetical protein